jgi:lactose/L-arabinose transport system ATP-binding protein
VAGDGTRITVEAHDQSAPKPGSKVGLSVADGAALFFDAENGNRLR